MAAVGEDLDEESGHRPLQELVSTTSGKSLRGSAPTHSLRPVWSSLGRIKYARLSRRNRRVARPGETSKQGFRSPAELPTEYAHLGYECELAGRCESFAMLSERGRPFDEYQLRPQPVKLHQNRGRLEELKAAPALPPENDHRMARGNELKF